MFSYHDFVVQLALVQMFLYNIIQLTPLAIHAVLTQTDMLAYTCSNIRSCSQKKLARSFGKHSAYLLLIIVGTISDVSRINT